MQFWKRFMSYRIVFTFDRVMQHFLVWIKVSSSVITSLKKTRSTSDWMENNLFWLTPYLLRLAFQSFFPMIRCTFQDVSALWTKLMEIYGICCVIFTWKKSSSVIPTTIRLNMMASKVIDSQQDDLHREFISSVFKGLKPMMTTDWT